jgi:hypothetical protein
MRRLIPFLLLTLLLAGGAQEARAQVDITGTWEISWETQRGATTSTFTFEQDGDTREIEVTDGKVDGDQITFSMAMGRGERSFTFTFAGTVDGDAMEGTMTTMRGENPFTGKKKE